MKIKQLVMLLIIIFLVVGSATLIYYSFFKVVLVQKTTYIFSVKGHAGLVGDRDALKFGIIPYGGAGSRQINLTNDFDFPVKVKITIKGEKSEWITAQDNNFLLEPGTYREIEMVVKVPAYAKEHMNYTGTVTAYYIKS